MFEDRIKVKIVKYVKNHSKSTTGEIKNVLNLKDGNEIESCVDLKYLKYNETPTPATLKITENGIQFLREHSLFDKKQILPIVISSIITIIAVYIAFNLQKPYLEGIMPEIRIYPYLYSGEIELPEIRDKNLLTIDSEPLRLCVQNIGKRETGMVQFSVESTQFSSTIQSIDNLPNKEGQYYECKTVYVRDDNCYKHNICNITTIPKGRVTLNVFATCQNCLSQRYNFPIDVCIFHTGLIRECRNQLK